MPRFSIIVPHFQGSTTHAEFLRGYNSLLSQTFKDFEILLYHDGPLLDTTAQFPIPITCMDKNYKDWGHTIRDRGIHQATGDYILHFNSDNILYPNALEEIHAATLRPYRIFDPDGKPVDHNHIIIFAILMRGMQYLNRYHIAAPDYPEYAVIFTGFPPIPGRIDALQLVMKRQLWIEEGGWTEKSYEGDGILYQRFTSKYCHRTLEKILGEHY